jgi:hypothetical protein
VAGSKGSRPRDSVKGAKLEPIRVVRRELRRPDGSTLEVDVPVYPPFRLEERPEKRPAKRREAAAKPPKRETG